MDVTISGRHVAVTDGMRDHARARAERLDRLSRHLMRVKITLTIEGGRNTAEVIASVRKRGEVVAKSVTHDMYLAIDQAVAKSEKQLQKVEEQFHRKRDAALRKRGVRGGMMPIAEPPEAASPEEEE